jgi:hypothetical protein
VVSGAAPETGPSTTKGVAQCVVGSFSRAGPTPKPAAPGAGSESRGMSPLAEVFPDISNENLLLEMSGNASVIRDRVARQPHTSIKLLLGKPGRPP